MVQSFQHAFEPGFEHLEVQQHFCVLGQVLPFHGELYGKIVAVQTFAFAFVVPQGVGRSKIVPHGQTPEMSIHESIQETTRAERMTTTTASTMRAF